MKRELFWLGCAALLATGTPTLHAAEPNIGVANMELILKEHQRLKTVIDQLNEQNTRATEERKQMVNEMEQQQTELRKLRIDSQRSDKTEAERSANAAKAETKLHDVRVIEARILRADEANRRQMATQLQQVRQQYFSEIQGEIRAYASEHHLALVLDSSALATQSGVGGVLHADAQLDITAAIITRVNTLRPPTATTTQSCAAPKK